uniref:Uncharacterized protein n=1 Tax=Glossina pallidipes TaxID=7398 RepID=A0A1A9Z547_GLOPL
MKRISENIRMPRRIDLYIMKRTSQLCIVSTKAFRRNASKYTDSGARNYGLTKCDNESTIKCNNQMEELSELGANVVVGCQPLNI